jgi:hypothetical protein
MTAWKFSFAGASVALATTVLTAAILAHANPAAPPATQSAATVSAELSTPLQTILALGDSWANNSPDAYDKVHITGSPDEQSYAAAVRAILTAQQRAIDAWRRTLDPADTSSFPRTALYTSGLTDAQVRGIQVSLLDDHTADVAVPGLMHYCLTKGQDGWKIQIHASVATRSSDPAKMVQLLTGMFRDLADLYTQTADRIDAGELRTLPAITRFIDERRSKILADHDPALSAITLPDP